MAAVAALGIVMTAAPRPAQAMGFSPDALYAAQCSSCHGDRMEGGQFGPALKSDSFKAKWTGKRDELFKFISHNMPPGGSGQLGEGDYRAVTKFIADANQLDVPAGAAPPPQRVGHLGPRSAPELWEDAFARQAKAAQAAKLAALTPVTAQMLRDPPAADWLTWRRNQDLTGFSPLDQINRQTAGKLKLKWAWSMKPGRNELAPLVHDGVLFIHNADEVEALDAATGTLLWHYVRDIAPEFRGPFTMVERSFSMFGTNLYVATPDRHVIALDMKTGKLVWDTEIVPHDMANTGLSSGPYVAGNVIVQGTSMGPFCTGGCWVTGLDPATGRKLWRFDDVAQSGKAGETWNGLPPKERTGAATWAGGSYDPKLDLLFFGTAGTYDVNSLLDPGPGGKLGKNAALYTNSTIALRPSTGELVWYHQHIPRELWDLDEVFERMLVTVPVEGKEEPAVIEIGKMGILDGLDRKDGHYLFSFDFGLDNLVTRIDPKTGYRSIDPAKVPARDKQITVCPSVDGVRNWMATSYNPSTHILYVPILEVCMDFVRTVGDDGTDGKLDMGWVFKPRPDTDGKYGRIQAVDLATRKTLWIKRSRPLTASSLLDTAGGVLFQGDTYRGFGAIDDRTGETLWETRLNGNPSATPITFTAGGKQYVAVVTGGGGGHDITTPDMTPEEPIPAAATTVWVFGL